MDVNNDIPMCQKRKNKNTNTQILKYTFFKTTFPVLLLDIYMDMNIDSLIHMC